MLKRKIMGLFLAAAMIVTMLPASALTAHAEEGAEPVLTEQSVITEIRLTGVTAPEVDGYPRTSDITVADGAHYSVVAGRVAWFDRDAWRNMSDGDVFEAGKEYELIVYLTPAAGYSFGDGEDITVSIDGIPEGYCSCRVSDTEVGDREVEVFFRALPEEARVIREVSLAGGALPVIGQTAGAADLSFRVPDGAHYSLEYMTWINVSDGEMEPVMKFEEGKVYRLIAAFLPEPGYAFAAEGSLTGSLSDIPSSRYHLEGVYKQEVNDVYGGAVAGFEFTPQASYPQFSDVTDSSQFYFDAVYWAADRGITTGWPDGTFRPLNSCNRASVVTFLWRLAGRPEPMFTADYYFTDPTENSEFDTAIGWAYEEGITAGFRDGTFRPWQACNRASIVTFLWRFDQRPPVTHLAGFTDMPEDNPANADFRAAISWAASQSITTGWPDGTFRPWNTCNRLSVVSFLYRFAQNAGIA